MSGGGGYERGRVAVVGAGLAGLRAAAELAAQGFEVVVLEARERAGGKVAGECVDGFALGRSLELLSYGDRRLLGWIREAGVESALMPLRAVGLAQLYRGRIETWRRHPARLPGVGLRSRYRLMRLPRLMKRYRPLLDLDAPERAADLDWRSVSDFGSLYFGNEVLDRFVGPVATEATLGDAASLSRVAFLLAWEARREGGALPGLAAAGLHELVEAVSAKLGVRTGTRVEAVEADGSGFALSLTGPRGEERLDADAVLLTVPPREVGRIAPSLLTPPERDFVAGSRTLPRITLTVALDRAPVSQPRYVCIPHVEGSPIEAVLAEPGLAGSRVPEGAGLVGVRANAAFGRTHLGVTEEVVHKSLLTALERILPGVGTSVRFLRLDRDEKGAPSWEVGTYVALRRFQNVQTDRRAGGRRLYFAGDHLAGPRLEDAVASGSRAARALVADC